MDGASATVTDCRQFFEQHSNELYNSLFHQVIGLTRNKTEAEEITQTTFLQFVERMQHVDWRLNSDAVRSYLSKTAKNLCRDMWRKRSKSATVSYDDDAVQETIERRAVESDNSVAQLDNRVYYQQLFAALPNMVLQGSTEYERQLLQLRRVEQLSWREIADLVGRSIPQARYDLQKLEARIRYRVAKITVGGKPEQR